METELAAFTSHLSPLTSHLKIGFVGLRRAMSFAPALRLLPDVEVFAGCDTDPQILQELGGQLGIERRFADYGQFLDAGPNAVVIGTPMPYHALQAVAALRRGIHVLSEVPAVVDLTQAWELVEAQRSSSAVYMMAENYCYMKKIGVVREMVRAGLFGDVYYGEGEYLHELKELNELTPWRRVWQTGRNGVTYGTHSLGPLLWWIEDRVVRVSGSGSGHHYRDPRGAAYENEDTCLMLCQLGGGGLVRVRIDMLSNRPHLMTYYALQGTKGCFESARGPGDMDKVWLADRSEDPNTWRSLWDFAEEFTPAQWRQWEAEAQRAGHGGGDLLEVLDFVTAIREGTPPPVDLYAALDFSLPGLVSQESIARGGVPLPVPDFRSMKRFPDDLPQELQQAEILQLATAEGDPAWKAA
jgi:predicted dehydrogenase